MGEEEDSDDFSSEQESEHKPKLLELEIGLISVFNICLSSKFINHSYIQSTTG